MLRVDSDQLISFFDRHAWLRSPLKWVLLNIIAPFLMIFGARNRKRKAVLFVGQAYYNSWYLSRALRKLGWKADLLNYDLNAETKGYYHGEDFNYVGQNQNLLSAQCIFFFRSLFKYDIFHFANQGGLQFGDELYKTCTGIFEEPGIEVLILRSLGKKIIYSHNGCTDGVSQTAFRNWSVNSPCSSCSWRTRPEVCSDEKNLEWGKLRNSLADFQCSMGVNRADFNIAPNIHATPLFYCLNDEVWSPDLEIPSAYERPSSSSKIIRLYHSVGNMGKRTSIGSVNIKSTHIYLPLVHKLQAQGMNIDLINPTGIPNLEVRFLQAQADIVLEMLEFGWFGANAREAMMLGKPVICYLRQEWLDSLRQEIPDYVDELPIVRATPETIESVLLDLISNEKKRIEIGRRGRKFCIKYHSDANAARHFDAVYQSLLERHHNE